MENLPGSSENLRNPELLVHSSKWQEILEFLLHRKNELVSEVVEDSQNPDKPLRAELLLNLNERQRRELLQVSSAITRILRNQYGECEVCEDEISDDLLRRFPYLRLCLDCQRQSREVSLNRFNARVS